MAHFGIETAVLRANSFEEGLQTCLKLAKKYNLTSTELALLEDKTDNFVGYWYYRKKSSALEKYLRNFQVTSFHLPFADLNPVSNNLNAREFSITELKKAISVASDYGVDYCVMHLEGHAFNKGDRETLSLWNEALFELVEYSDERTVELSIENYAYLHSLNKMAKFLHAFKALSMTLDIGHLQFQKPENALGQYKSLRHFLLRFKSRLQSLHIHDFKECRGGVGGRDHLPLGKGNIDFSELIESLRAINYGGTLTLEIGTYSERIVEQSIRRMLKLFETL